MVLDRHNSYGGIGLLTGIEPNFSLLKAEALAFLVNYYCRSSTVDMW